MPGTHCRPGFPYGYLYRTMSRLTKYPFADRWPLNADGACARYHKVLYENKYVGHKV